MLVHARFALAYVALHALTIDHHDRGELWRRIVLLGVTSGTLEPRLFCFLKCGRFGPRSVSSSRMLYRKRPKKSEQIE